MNHFLELRVNGIDIPTIRVRRKLEFGFPSDNWEVVIEDPMVGTFAIEDGDNFLLEIRRTNKSEWEPTSLRELLLLIDMKYNAHGIISSGNLKKNYEPPQVGS